MSKTKEKYSLSTLAAFGLTALLPMATATGFSNFERGRHVILALLAGVALVGWAVGVFRQGSVKVHSPGTLLLGALFAFFAALSLTWSNLALFGLISVTTWLSLGAIFLVLSAPTGKRPAFLDWATVVGVGASAAGLMGLYEFVGGTGLIPVWRPSGIAGGFDSIAFAASYYTLAIPVLLAGVGVAKGNRRWFMAGATVLATLHLALVVDLLFLGVLGAAMVLSAVMVGVLSRVKRGEGTQKTLMAAGAVILAAILGFALMERPTVESDAVDLPRIAPSEIFTEELAQDELVRWPYFAADRMESALDQRYRPYLNSVTRGLFQQEPLLGHGAGGWSLMQSSVVDEGEPALRELFFHYPQFKSPHNDYSRILVEQGLLGLVFFILFLAGVLTALIGGVRGEKDSEESALILWGLLATFLVGLATMYFVPVLELKSSALLWISAAAMGVLMAGEANEESQWLSSKEFFSGLRVAHGALLVLAIAGAAAISVPALLHGQSALERGHGDHLMLRSHFEEAKDYYRSAHQRYPAHGEVLYNIALSSSLHGGSEEDYDLLMEAVEMRPYDARILTYAAVEAMKTSRIETGLALAEEAVRTGPNYLPAYDAYAALLQRRARHEESGDVLKAALERNPPRKFTGVINLRLGILYSQTFEEWETALEYMLKALEEMPHSSEREYVAKRVDELNKRMEREELEAQGLPIPPHLMPEEPHDHSHHHHHPHPPMPGGQDQGDLPGPPTMPGLPEGEHQHHYHD